MVDSLVVVLLLTLPSVKASQVWVPPQDRDAPADSMAASCVPSTTPLYDLDSLVFYGYPLSGGGFRRIHAKRVRGREGQPDSTRIVLYGTEWLNGGRFYITTKTTTSKESCPSNIVSDLRTVTGVEPEPAPRVVVEEWFDVQGRRLSGPVGTGIRFVRWTVKGRFIGQQRVIVLRGKVLTRIRRPDP